jgi:hypothetical protein
MGSRVTCVTQDACAAPACWRRSSCLSMRDVFRSTQHGMRGSTTTLGTPGCDVNSQAVRRISGTNAGRPGGHIIAHQCRRSPVVTRAASCGRPGRQLRFRDVRDESALPRTPERLRRCSESTLRHKNGRRRKRGRTVLDVSHFRISPIGPGRRDRSGQTCVARGRTTISFTSTSFGCSITNWIVRPIASGWIAILR